MVWITLQQEGLASPLHVATGEILGWDTYEHWVTIDPWARDLLGAKFPYDDWIGEGGREITWLLMVLLDGNNVFWPERIRIEWKSNWWNDEN